MPPTPFSLSTFNTGYVPSLIPPNNIQNTTHTIGHDLSQMSYRYLNRTPERAPGDSYSGKVPS